MRILTLACIGLSLARPAAARDNDECVTVDKFLPRVKAEASAVLGGTVMIISDAAAAQILNYINRHGQPTNYQGDRLVVLVEGTMNYGVVKVMPFIHDCINEKDGFSVSPRTFIDAINSLPSPTDTDRSGI